CIARRGAGSLSAAFAPAQSSGPSHHVVAVGGSSRPLATALPASHRSRARRPHVTASRLDEILHCGDDPACLDSHDRSARRNGEPAVYGERNAHVRIALLDRAPIHLDISSLTLRGVGIMRAIAKVSVASARLASFVLGAILTASVSAAAPVVQSGGPANPAHR